MFTRFGPAILAALFLFSAPHVFADVSQAIVTDVPRGEYSSLFGRIPGSALTHEDSMTIATQKVTGDTLKILAIPVEWSNRPGTYSIQTLDSMLFSRGVYPGGSMADWIAENSYGKVAIQGTVLDWYNAGYYSGSSFDFEPIFPVLDPVVDYSQFDGNHDGVADAVIFIRAGTGQEDSHDTYDIWSYAYIYTLGYGPGPYDGVMISRWNTSPELRPLHDETYPPQLTGAHTLNSIRVFCHETSHNLGLWDLYDYDAKLDFDTYNTPNDDNDHPVYDWDIMGYGGYGYFSIKSPNPSHMCGYQRVQLGWLTPIELTGTNENLVLYNIETRDDSCLYMVTIGKDGQEYFLLEYRNPRSSALFDKTDSDFSSWFPNYLQFGPDTLDRGLLITHVDQTASGAWDNDGTPRYPHYRVAVEDAGYDPARPVTYNPEGNVSDSAQWWYPYETRKGALFSNETAGQEEFGPSTVPNSNTYDDGPSGVVVRVDSIVDDRLYLYVNNPNDFDGDGDGISALFDNCPDTYNPDQADFDNDSIGDVCDLCPSDSGSISQNADPDGDGFGMLCDNCPLTYNPGQEDINSNGIGDACEFPDGAAVMDTISTNCLSLVVDPDLSFGGGAGYPGVSMDYSNSGECDPAASQYLFWGWVFLGSDDGTDTLVYMPELGGEKLFVTIDGNPFTPTETSAPFDEFWTGTRHTADSSVGLELTWWAPRTDDSVCNFVVQCLRVYSFDGQSHSGFTLGQMLDWDIPSDGGNNGAFDADRRLVYQQGIEYDQSGCQLNTGRFGALSLIGTTAGETPCYLDTLAAPPAAYTASNNSDLNPGPNRLYEVASSKSGYSAVSGGDIHSVMVLSNDLTVPASDTLYYFSIMLTTRDVDQPTMLSMVDRARSWVTGSLMADIDCNCCRGATGNVNADPNDVVDVSDLTLLVNRLFVTFQTLECPEEANTSGDAGGVVDVSDLTALVNHLFVTFEPLPNCQ